MYCKNCGQFLSGKENFCSNCGSKVVLEEKIEEKTFEKPNGDIGFIKRDSEETTAQNTDKKAISMPEINWNTEEFNRHKKKEEMTISWRNDDMFLQKELNEVNDNLSLNAETLDEGERESYGFVGTDKKSESDENFAESEEKKADRDTKSNLEIPKVFKDAQDEERKPEFLKDDHVVEVEQPSNRRAIEVSGDEEVIISDGKERIVSEIEPEIKISENEDIAHTSEYSFYFNEAEEMESSVKNEDTYSQKIEATSDGEKESSEAVVENEKQEEMEIEAKEAKTLFDEIAPEAVHTLENAKIDEDKKRIDKFYTFNKKKEEFQKLLDKEYERIEKNVEAGGLEEDISKFMDVELGTDVDATTQLEEMVRARELFFDTPREYQDVKNNDEKIEGEKENKIEIEDLPSQEIIEDTKKDGLSEKKIEEEKAEITDDGISRELIDGAEEKKSDDDSEPETADAGVITIENDREDLAAESDDSDLSFLSDDSDEDKGISITQIDKDEYAKDDKEDESKTQKESKSEENIEKSVAKPAQVIIDPEKNAEKNKDDIAEKFFEDMGEDKHKMGKGSKILLWILGIITFSIIVLFAIRVFLPTSYIAKQIDTVSTKIVSVFKGADSGKTDEQKDDLSIDKTELIKSNIKDKKTNEFLSSVKFDGDLKYSKDNNKAFDGISKAKITSGLTWKEDGKEKITYDKAIIGRMIEFESAKNDYIEGNSNSVLDMIDKDSDLYNAVKELKGSKEKVKELKIGDIKMNGQDFFIWVSEDNESEVVKKIYRLTIKDDKFIFTGESKIQ